MNTLNSTEPSATVSEAARQSQPSPAEPAPSVETPPPPPAKDVKSTTEDLDFVADTKAAFLEDKSPYASILLFLIVGIVSGLTFWAASSTIDEVTRGQGKVIPTDSLQIVQSLEGGILSELLVKEGALVQKGEILLRIDDTAFSAAHSEGIAQRDNLMATIARLEAEANGDDRIEFPSYILNNRSDLVSSETRLFESRRQNLATTVKHLSRSLELKNQELTITRPLAERGIVSQVELLRLESAVNDTQGELDRIQSEYTKEVLTKRNEATGKLEQLRQSIIGYEDKIRRATVLSPAFGRVNKVHFKTIGGVIRGGDPIIEIVPEEGDLIVEADVLPADIGFIHPGQEATVKLTAYDFSIYGGLKGTVERISADTFTNERGESFYKIRVRTGERSLKTGAEDLKIIPGMQVEVDILTGEKTVLAYIFKPLLRAKMNALTER